MDIDQLSLEEVRAFLGRLGDGDEEARRECASMDVLDQLRLIKRVTVSDAGLRGKIIDRPRNLAEFGGTVNIKLIRRLCDLGQDRIAFAIQLLKQRLGRSPSLAEVAEYYLDEVIETLSDQPHVLEKIRRNMIRRHADEPEDVQE